RGLRELQIAQERQLREFCLYLLAIRVVVLKADALHGDLDRRRRSETHHLSYDVGRFEGYLALRKLLAEPCTQFFAKQFSSGRGWLHCDLNNRFLGTAGEQMNQVHR